MMIFEVIRILLIGEIFLFFVFCLFVFLLLDLFLVVVVFVFLNSKVDMLLNFDMIIV